MIERYLNSSSHSRMPPGNGDRNDLYFRMHPEDTVLFEMMTQGKPGLLGIQYTYIILITKPLYRVIRSCFGLVRFCIDTFAGRTKHGRLPRYPDPRKRKRNPI